jgi:hypothetical protein
MHETLDKRFRGCLISSLYPENSPGRNRRAARANWAKDRRHHCHRFFASRLQKFRDGDLWFCSRLANLVVGIRARKVWAVQMASRRSRERQSRGERHVRFREHLFRSSVLGPRSSLGDDALKRQRELLQISRVSIRESV